MSGFYGKLPSRGDFVGTGLPAAVVDAFDGWMRACLAASSKALGDDWVDCWMEAPVWRFITPVAGTALGGVWLPSMDRVGRWFPLVITTSAGDAGPAWMDQAEALGFEAVTGDLVPDTLAMRLAELAPDPCEPRNGWWTSGAPRKAAVRVDTQGLPDPAGFVWFLNDATMESVR